MEQWYSENMNLSRPFPRAPQIRFASVFAALLFMQANLLSAEPPGGQAGPVRGRPAPGRPAYVCELSLLGSPFIPVDSWIYPAILRLYSLGYIDDVFLGLRPWTRTSVNRMLEVAGSRIDDADADGNPTAKQAREIYDAINYEFRPDTQGPCGPLEGDTRVESVYSVARGISGTPLRDSFHLGSTIINDYGRPYENGFNNYSGASGYAAAGRFTFYVRGEFQGAPSAVGYSPGLYQTLAVADDTTNPVIGRAYPNQITIPLGPIGTAVQGRFLEAYVSAQVMNHVISFGKQDEWMGPAEGASMAYSNNAENIYALHINRIEPLYIPLISRLTGPFRYEFLVGPLRGHALMSNPRYPGPNQPNVISAGDPWVHVEKVNFRPTPNVEFGFERTVLWGGEGHSPVNLHTFLKSFASVQNVSEAEKFGTGDPGARFGSFDFSYRLPFMRNWLTFYTDAEVHDDVSAIDAPRRASWRPGLYLSHVPGAPGLDIRFEGAMTDPAVTTSTLGRFMYWESIERQGYTNQGQLFGDWLGREDKGGQAWITYHLSGNEWLQVSARNQKAAKDFVPGGTTLNDISFQAVKRIGKDFEVNGNFNFEHWKAPVYPTGTPVYPAPQNTVTSTTIQLTWYPERKVSF
jgi:hypothetical protein